MEQIIIEFEKLHTTLRVIIVVYGIMASVFIALFVKNKIEEDDL